MDPTRSYRRQGAGRGCQQALVGQARTRMGQRAPLGATQRRTRARAHTHTHTRTRTGDGAAVVGGDVRAPRPRLRRHPLHRQRRPAHAPAANCILFIYIYIYCFCNFVLYIIKNCMLAVGVLVALARASSPCIAGAGPRTWPHAPEESVQRQATRAGLLAMPRAC